MSNSFEDEIFAAIVRPDIVPRPDCIKRARERRKVFGPRQIEWLIDTLNDAWAKLPNRDDNAGMYRVAFENIVIEIGKVIEMEERKGTKTRKKTKFDRLSLFEKLEFYRERERRELDKGKAEQAKRERDYARKWGIIK